MKKIILFASGSGSNAENIIRYFQDKKTAETVAVFSNNPNAQVLDKAQKLGVPGYVFTKEELNSGKVLEQVAALNPDLIVLAGFLWKFPTDIVAKYPNKIVNIHPALLPKYGGKGMYGMNVHRAILENKESHSGISIHYVNENYDEGAMIFQAEVAVDVCITPEEIALKVQELEHLHFPQIIDKLLQS
ncbi:phosphoribosylglycinamide formyltransferase [Flavobacterium microcysteis]